MKRTSGRLLAAICILWPAWAEDWPEWRGKGRAGVWKETGILDAFPKEGLAVKWRNTDREVAEACF